MKLSFAVLSGLVISAVNGQIMSDNSTGFTWDPEYFKVAAVRYPPFNYAYPIQQNRTWVDLDLNKTIDKAVEYIKQAGDEGVKLIAFPELYFPGFPIGLNFEFTPENFAQFANQSMVWDGPEWKRLTAAFAENKMYAVVSFSEYDVEDDALYMAQYLVGPDGNTIHKHRKVRPSGGERNFFSDGDLSTIRAVTLPFGTVTMLSCWENLWPIPRFMAASQPANLHIASFPWNGAENENTKWYEVSEALTSPVRTYTLEAGVAAIMPAIGKPVIYEQYGVPGKGNTTELTDKDSFEAMPYITADLNATTWLEPKEYDINAQHSWSAVMELVSGFSPEIPRKFGTFFNKYTSKVSDMSKYYVITPRTPTNYANATNWPSLYENYGQINKLVQPEEYE